MALKATKAGNRPRTFYTGLTVMSFEEMKQRSKILKKNLPKSCVGLKYSLRQPSWQKLFRWFKCWGSETTIVGPNCSGCIVVRLCNAKKPYFNEKKPLKVSWKTLSFKTKFYNYDAIYVAKFQDKMGKKKPQNTSSCLSDIFCWTLDFYVRFITNEMVTLFLEQFKWHFCN